MTEQVKNIIDTIDPDKVECCICEKVFHMKDTVYLFDVKWRVCCKCYMNVQTGEFEVVEDDDKISTIEKRPPSQMSQMRIKEFRT